MRKIRLMIFSVFMVTIILLSGVDAQTPIELKLASWATVGMSSHEVVKAGAAWIENRFPGRVKVTIYPAQTLVPGPASYESTVKGVCDIACNLIPGWTRGRFPKTDVIDLAPNFQSSLEASLFYWDFFNKFLKDEWAGVKVLGLYVQPPMAFHMGKKPVYSFEDIKGEKMRVYGMGKDMMEAFGGIPVSMPLTEAFEAIRTGIASGLMTVFSDLPVLHLDEVCFYHTDVGVLASPLFHIMNLKKYNSLPSDIKKALDEELPAYWASEGGKIWDRWEEKGKELIRKSPRHQFISLTPGERAKWIERAMSINDKWASALEAKGLPGRKLVEEKVRGTKFTK